MTYVNLTSNPQIKTTTAVKVRRTCGVVGLSLLLLGQVTVMTTSGGSDPVVSGSPGFFIEQRSIIAPRLLDAARPINYNSPQSQGLVAAWPMQLSYGSNKIKDPIGGHDGVANGGVQWAYDQQMGPVLRFDGTGQVSFPSPPPITDDIMMVDCWVRSNEYGGSGTVLSWGATPDAGQGVRLDFGDSAFFSTYDSGNASTARGGSGLANGRWHHLVGLWSEADPSQTYVSLLVDGVLVRTTYGYRADPTRLNTFIFGGRWWYGNRINSFVGDMTFPRIRYTSDISTAFESFAPQTRWSMLNSADSSMYVPGTATAVYPFSLFIQSLFVGSYM